MISRPTLLRGAIFLAAVVATWGVLSLGSSANVPTLEPGQPSPMAFEAARDATVIDTVATAELEQEARDSVDPVKRVNTEIQQSVENSINQLFDDVERLVVLEPAAIPPGPIPELPAETTTTTAGEGSTTTIPASQTALITGRVYIDVDGSGTYNPDAEGARVDVGLRGISVQIRTDGDLITKQTGADGLWSADISTGAAVVTIDDSDPEVPRGWIPGSGEVAQLITCAIGDECATEDVGFVVSLRPIADVEATLDAEYDLPGPTIAYVAATASDDVIRAALGEPLHLRTVREVVLEQTREEFGRLIEPADLQESQARQRTNPPLVFHADSGQDVPGGEAAGEIVATFLLPNYLIDDAETQRLRDEEAEKVEPVEVDIVAGQTIVDQGEILTQFDIDAIEETARRGVSSEPASLGLLGVVAVLAGLLGLYLARFRPEFWSRPRMVALLGILVLLAAGAVRATVVVSDATSLYVVPAVAFGFMTAVLFDQRIGLLMALAVGVLTAAGTFDTGITVYAVLAAMAPIPFISSVSSRGAFRNAVVLSSLVATAIAASTSWFFHVGPNDSELQIVGISMAWAFGISVVSSLVGLAALQFFESSFDITTALSLLDLTDRNHKALQLLQEKAFGSFNHSLMVGTLADAASRAIGANPLLARAMAYYHDLGKTENPTFFIENQFGISNPHDLMDPWESAEVIRSHVTAGVALARQFKIPTDVTQGIVSHHGDGVMRYFYEKARSLRGEDVSVDDFRHIGHKPRTAETAILMLADSLEAACRAVFQTEEPTSDAIEKVVNRIVDEKVEDGQLSESPITLAELTQIRKAFLDSLVGHYHQRIAYPNFPGS